MNIELWGWYSLAVNLLLVLLHGIIAAASGSLAVAAEWIHNLADLLAAAAVLFGLKLAARKSVFFPYGLYKVENLVAVGLAAMIFLSAYEIGRQARIGTFTPVHVKMWMLAILLATTFIPLVFGHFELRTGQAANSPALIADAKEYRVHVLTTGLVFAALFSDWLRIPLDRIAAMAIVVLVVKSAWDLLRDAMRVLLDASLDTETLLRIRKVIDADPAVAEVKWTSGRNAGRFRFVESGVALRVVEREQAEVAVQRIEAAVRREVPHIERVLVHVEAAASPHIRYAVPLADSAGTISAHFGQAPYFALVVVRRIDSSVVEQRVVRNPYQTEEKAKGIRVAEWLVAQKVDLVLVRENLQGKGPGYVLGNAGVEPRRTDKLSLAEAIAS